MYMHELMHMVQRSVASHTHRMITIFHVMCSDQCLWHVDVCRPCEATAALRPVVPLVFLFVIEILS